MASFNSLIRQLQEDSSEEEDKQLKSLIKRGLELRPERTDGMTFWDDFLSLFGGHSESAAQLFGVRPEAISRATNHVRRLKDEITDENDRSEKKRKKSFMLHTGDL